MAAAGPPWSVSTPAQAAGLAALEQCSDWPEKARALLASERPALSDGLAALGLESAISLWLNPRKRLSSNINRRRFGIFSKVN